MADRNNTFVVRGTDKQRRDTIEPSARGETTTAEWQGGCERSRDRNTPYYRAQLVAVWLSS